MRPQLAELLLDMRFRGVQDRLRKRHPFSPDIAATNAILFSRQYTRREKIRHYRQWLETNQPCVFGKVAAKSKSVFVCLLEEDEVLRMRNGDDDVRATIQDYRQAWKRHALDGLSSSFVLLVVSPTLTEKEPDDRLKEISRRLLELYMGVSPIPDDTIIPQREYVFLRLAGRPKSKSLLKFATLPNVFCAQGDGRWWQDHRTPGGIMITSNALGHFTYVRQKVTDLSDKDRLWALENAMRTIGNAAKGNVQPRIKHCPATHLIARGEAETSPLRDSSDFKPFSCRQYEGFFHTDQLLPSAFFRAERDPKDLTKFVDLSFSYIWDRIADADHDELVAGLPASWYEVRQNLDRLPDFVNPESTENYPDNQRARLATWLEKRLAERI